MRWALWASILLLLMTYMAATSLLLLGLYSRVLYCSYAWQ